MTIHIECSDKIGVHKLKNQDKFAIESYGTKGIKITWIDKFTLKQIFDEIIKKPNTSKFTNVKSNGLTLYVNKSGMLKIYDYVKKSNVLSKNGSE